MNAWPAIQTWNRGELEDKFYKQYDQLIILKKKNNELERRLRLTSTKIRQTLQNEEHPETNEHCRELERENRLLIQKLKALRHQLINYTRPQSHNTTLNFLTSRTTARPQSSVEEKPLPQKVNNGYYADVSEVTNRTTHIIETPINDPKNTNMEKILEEKATIIKLHREIREKSEEVENLQFQLSKNEQKLGNLRSEYDKLVQELEKAKNSLEEIKVVNGPASETNSATIVEKELTILREENKVLKAANERFISNSLNQEKDEKSAKELQNLQKHVQETEIKLAEFQNQNRSLNKKLKELESEKRSINEKYRTLKNSVEKNIIQDKMLPEKSTIEDEAPRSSPNLPKIEHKHEKRRKSKMMELSVLDRLFEDVASIVDSHRTSSPFSSDQEPATNSKWRQLYEEVYAELEKVRNLLLIQFRITERQKKEISVLNEFNDENKREYEKKLAEFVAELNRRAKRIEVLENQLKLVAAGKFDFDSSILTDSNVSKEINTVSTTELILELKKLTFTENGLKILNLVEPTIFLSLEFFDFELETTPLIHGSEASFDYSTAYDIVVSNLFIHYIQKEGINVEIFEVRGASYEQIGSGVISLKKILETETPSRITGQLSLIPVNGQGSIAILDYSLNVPFNLSAALKKQRRKMTASIYLSDGLEDNSLHNELQIQIHRCTNLELLSKTLPSTYVAYQIYDLPVHLTKVVKNNSNPLFDDFMSYTLPIGSALHSYLKTQELSVHVIQEGSGDGNQRALGNVSLPLFVLARNQKLQGTFLLLDENGQVSAATIDLSVHWKFKYSFEDENLKVEDPIPVKFSRITDKEIVGKTVESTEKTEPEKVNEFSDVSSNNSTDDVNTIIENPPKSSEIVSIASSPSNTSSDDTYVVDDDDLDTDLKEKIRETNVNSTTKNHNSNNLPSELSTESQKPEDIQPRPESSPVEKPEAETKKTQGLEKSTSSSDATDSDDLEHLKEELEKIEKQETESEGEINEEERKKTPTIPEKLPPIPPPRRITKVKGVEFTEPLHSSIPPSEESSLAGSAEGTPRTKNGKKVFQKSIPNLSATAATSVIKQTFQEQFPTGSHSSSEFTITIRLGRLSIVEESKLLDPHFDDVNVFIEWSLLDFANELCETPESVPVPRNTWKAETFECEKIYELNARRVALLRQWIEAQNHLNFTLVSDPLDDEGCDDLGVAQLDLADVISTSVHCIFFHDVNGEPIAALDLTVQYSDELTKQLTDEQT